MTAQLLIPPGVTALRKTHGFFDDFLDFNTGDAWTSLVVDAGTSAAASDAAGGVVVLTTAGTDNNEVAVKRTKETFLTAAGKPITFYARAQYAEANTDDANVLIGILDAIAANAMVDDGAGPKSSFSGAAFYKVDGGTRWQCISSQGSTRTTTDLTAALSYDKVAKTAGGSSYQEFQIDIRPIDGTRAEVDFYIDGVLVAQHDLTYTSATEMMAGAYIKAGGANSEVLNVDYIGAWQTR